MIIMKYCAKPWREYCAENQDLCAATDLAGGLGAVPEEGQCGPGGHAVAENAESGGDDCH